MEHPLLKTGSEALRKAALNEKAKEYILRNKPIYELLKKAAERYIGGETLEETIPKVKKKNLEGFQCSVEFMGENTHSEEEANKATEEFLKVCQAIASHELDSVIALDLSHIGLSVSKELAFQNLIAICEAAKKANTEVTISAEGADKTDAVLETYRRASPLYANLGITLQAYLYRSENDLKELLKEQGRIVIVKGAFRTPEGLSMPRGEKLDKVYLEFVEKLLSQNHKCSIATHHDKIQQEAKKLIRKYNPAKEMYEFESLYGVQNEQLAALKNEGHPAKIYFVYGKEWYLYLCNRLAENPLNIFRALEDITEPHKL